MAFDYPTLVFAASGTIAVVGLLCLMMARAEVTLRPLRLCGFGNLCLALGIPLLLVLRGGPYEAFGIVLGNSIFFLGWGLQAAAVRRFAGRTPWLWLAPAAAGVWWAACLVPAFMASFPTRAMLGSGIAFLLSALVAWELGRCWTGWRPLRAGIPLLCGIHPAMHVIRMAAIGLQGAEGASVVNPAMIVSGLLDILVCTFILIAEAMRRAERLTGARLAAAHAETATSRDLLAQLIENLPAVVYMNRIRPDHGWTRSFLGSNTERVIGWPRPALDPDDSLETRTVWTDAEKRAVLEELTTRGEVVIEVPMQRPDGRLLWVRRQSRVAARHADGSVSVVGTIIDITRERSLTAQMQASGKLATLGEMAANLAHELGQPAATMCLAASNAAKALRKQGEAAIPDALRRLDRIIDQGERMGALMQHLKAFARAEPLALGPVAVATAVEGAVVLTNAGLRQDQVDLVVELAPGLPLVQAQLVPLEQVLVNLLLNARDAICRQPPGAQRRIRLRAAQDGEGWVVIEVADTGGGLDAAILPRLFEPFVTTKPMGEGLGLALQLLFLFSAINAFFLRVLGVERRAKLPPNS